MQREIHFFGVADRRPPRVFKLATGALLVALLAFQVPSVTLAQAPSVRVVPSVQPAAVAPGTVFELQLTIELPEGWIAYDVEQQPDSVPPTRIYLDASPTFAPVDAFRGPLARHRPDPSMNHRLVRYFDQSPTFRRGMLVAPDAPAGSTPLSGRLDFQVRCEQTGRSYVIRKYPFRIEVTIGTAPLPAVHPEVNAPASTGQKVEPQILRPAVLPSATAKEEASAEPPAAAAAGAPAAPSSAASRVGPASRAGPRMPSRFPVGAARGAIPDQPISNTGAANPSAETPSATVAAAPVRSPFTNVERDGAAVRAVSNEERSVVGRYEDLFSGEFAIDRYAWLFGGVWWLAALGGVVGVVVGGLELRSQSSRRPASRLAACLATVLLVATVLHFAAGSALQWYLLLGALAAALVGGRIGRRTARALPGLRLCSMFWLTTALTLSSLAADQAGLFAATGAAATGLGLCTVLALVDPSWSCEILPVWKHPQWARR
jgi:hypothetical protein